MNFEQYISSFYLEKYVPPTKASYHFVERQFQGITPEGKIEETRIFVEDLGLTPDEALIRVVDWKNLPLVRAMGTERIDRPERPARSTLGEYLTAHNESSITIGMPAEDVLELTPLSEYVQFLKLNFMDGGNDGIYPHRTSIVVYKESSMELLDFGLYGFRDPQSKPDAIAGIIAMEPLPEDREFTALPTITDQVLFVANRLNKSQEEVGNIAYYFITDQMVKDLQENIAARLTDIQQKNSAALLEQQDLGKQLKEICARQIIEFHAIETYYSHIRIISNSERGNHNKEHHQANILYILNQINSELTNDKSSNYFKEQLRIIKEQILKFKDF